MKTIIDFWWDKGNKNFNISNFRKSWKESGNKPAWSFTTNGAKKSNPKDSCLDITITLGYIVVNYTNFNLQGITIPPK